MQDLYAGPLHSQSRVKRGRYAGALLWHTGGERGTDAMSRVKSALMHSVIPKSSCDTLNKAKRRIDRRTCKTFSVFNRNVLTPAVSSTQRPVTLTMAASASHRSAT